MSDERRYTGPEIEAIFEGAAERSESGGLAPTGDRGLTLPELQEIGAEVGLAPEAVAEAATALDRPGGIRTALGLPVAVSHTVPLPRDLTGDEWERLVADLRQTFDARGEVEVHGGLRQWTNGNLHALVEPTGSGYHLRMGTKKGNVPSLLGMGAVLLVVAVLAFVTMPTAGGVESGRLFVGVLMGLMGTGALAAATLPLPAWATERREQMEGVAERMRLSGNAPGHEEDSPVDGEG